MIEEEKTARKMGGKGSAPSFHMDRFFLSFHATLATLLLVRQGHPENPKLKHRAEDEALDAISAMLRVALDQLPDSSANELLRILAMADVQIHSSGDVEHLARSVMGERA